METPTRKPLGINCIGSRTRKAFTRPASKNRAAFARELQKIIDKHEQRS